MIFELIDIALGKRDSFSSNPSEADWVNLFETAKKQALLGVLAPALDVLSPEQSAPLGIYAKWMLIKESIVESSANAKSRCRDISSILGSEGKRCCILKGQSVALCYPHPELRQGGDIDVWVEDDWKSTFHWAKEHYSTKDFCYHHVEAGIFPEIKVELHFTPSWMNSPIHNCRLQRYFRTIAEMEFSNADAELGFCVTDKRFTAVFSVIHSFRHFFAEGVGLRQLMDCHYSILALSEEDRQEVMKDLKRLGLSRFTSALMYVLEKVFSLDREHLLCAGDSRKGEILLNEVMLSGNFGKYDSRYSWMFSKPSVKRALLKIWRISRFTGMAPAEAIFAPVFKLWQFLWIKWFSER